MKFSFFKKQRQTQKKPIRKIVVSINPLIIKDAKFEVRSSKFKRGFTLVELMVSVAITGILMIGISTFFSSTFSAMFRAQNRAGTTARQFAVNEIVRDKFTTLQTLVDNGADWMLSINKNTKNQLPFSYIGTTTRDLKEPSGNETYLAFKDLFVFNKIMDPGAGSHLYSNSGEGWIREAITGTGGKNFGTNNFAGFTKKKVFLGEGTDNKNYYIVVPHQNTVMDCDKDMNCTDLNLSNELRSPTDIEIDDNEEYLYISDSENNRIIRYKISDQTILAIAQPVQYPTGLAYYNDGTTEWLFFSETFSHKVKKINLSSGVFQVTTIAGEGDNEDCDSLTPDYELTAKFCKLNLPTGLFVNQAGDELYIADSGNNRVLKMSDPGIPSNLVFDFSPGGNYKLSKIVFENASWENGGTYDADNTVENNLIGEDGHYNPGTKTFQNPNTLSVYSDSNKNCESSGNILYVTENISTMGLIADDKLVIGSNVYTITGSPSRENCKADPSDGGEPDNYRHKIAVNGQSLSGTPNGEGIYLSNRDVIHIEIDISGIQADKIGPGFQTFEIKTYDVVTRSPVNTSYNTKRIGDGKIGTEEDVIEVIMDQSTYPSINFPTGVSSAYVANSGNNEVIKLDGTNSKLLKPINEIFTTFDYLSDFELATEDSNGTPLAPLIFETLNSGKILELTLNAKVDDVTIQTYKLNAAIPTP